MNELQHLWYLWWLQIRRGTLKPGVWRTQGFREQWTVGETVAIFW